MCGIAGILNLSEQAPVSEEYLISMLDALHHRGPDEMGIYSERHVAIGSARLSIIDIQGGSQPIGNEDQSCWIVFNGEIFNYLELRSWLETLGHTFSTQTDTEVILHMYESFGASCLNYLNGQYAIAIWDEKKCALFLARDRLGERPLFYTEFNHKLLFGSEIKSLLAYPGINAKLNPVSLQQAFTYWSVLSPRTIFQSIYELPPSHYMTIQNGEMITRRYWSLEFQEEANPRDDQEYLDELETLLSDAVRIRLRADVPVGAYLSGGIDSSTITALIQKSSRSHLETFSIRFSNPEFDETPFQQMMVNHLGIRHQEIICNDNEIGRVFPEVVWHAETPLLRTAPAPMYILSKLVNDNGYKVVLTGEGADEFFGGYDIFKEAKIRRFWSEQPNSTLRPQLFRAIYPDIAEMHQHSTILEAFFKKDLLDIENPYYSHRVRWNNSIRATRFFRGIEEDDLTNSICLPPLHLPLQFNSWSVLAKAQYIEIVTFLSTYLLSSQGDRMSMAHSVEGRYPYLDYRIVDFCCRLPLHVKMPGLAEKWLLRRFAKKILPEQIWKRRKRPYRAPIHTAFFRPPIPDYVNELLSEREIKQSGYFQPYPVKKLVDKARHGVNLTENEDIALVGILSTQLIDYQFIRHFSHPVNHSKVSPIKMVDRKLESLYQRI